MANGASTFPLRVALDNAIANSSIIPNEYVSQGMQDDNVRKPYQCLINVVVATIPDISEYCCAYMVIFVRRIDAVSRAYPFLP